jgi:hypothetical protein
MSGFHAVPDELESAGSQHADLAEPIESAKSTIEAGRLDPDVFGKFPYSYALRNTYESRLDDGLASLTAIANGLRHAGKNLRANAASYSGSDERAEHSYHGITSGLPGVPGGI